MVVADLSQPGIVMANYVVEYFLGNTLTTRRKLISAVDTEERALAKFREEVRRDPLERDYRPTVTSVTRSLA